MCQLFSRQSCVRSSLSPTGSGDVEGFAVVDYAVYGGFGSSGIAEDLCPFRVGEIGRDEETLSLGALRD